MAGRERVRDRHNRLGFDVPSNRWQSIGRRLPLLISLLLIATTAALSWTVYRRVERVLLTEAGNRLRAASLPLVQSLAEAGNRTRTLMGRAIQLPAIGNYLDEDGSPGGADPARQALGAMMAPAATRARVELLDSQGNLLLDSTRGTVPEPSEWSRRVVTGNRLRPGEVAIGPLQALGDTVYTEVVTAVPGSGVAGVEGDSVAGYLVDRRVLSTQSAQAEAIRNLIGEDVTLLVGADSDGVWVDLTSPRPVPAPPVAEPGVPLVYATSPRGAGVGVASPIEGTPWSLWVEQPRSTVLAPAAIVLRDVAIAAIIILLIAVVVAALLSRRITRPLLSLTQAAERVAASATGEFPVLRAPTDRSNEIVRLTDSFERMAERVSESRQQLEQRVADRTEELERALRQLERAQAQLVQKERLAVLGQLAGSVGHELRNPLGVMTNALFVIEQVTAEAPPMAREYIEVLRGQIAVAERIVGDLLDTTRVRPPQRAVVDIRGAVETQIRRLGPLGGVDVQLDVPHDLPPAWVDPTQFSQILLNLMTNAVQAMTDATTRTLTVTGRRAAPGRVSLEVRDTGAGMSPEVLQQIFEPLFTTKARGLGLGLWVTRSLAETNDAVLRVVSEPGCGSAFTLEMPCPPADGGQAA